MVAFAAAVTYVAIKIFPTKDRPDKEPEKPSDDGAGGGGRLFRRAKRGTT